MIDEKDFRKRVRIAMAELDIDQKELCRRADISAGNLSLWLKGETVPATASLHKLSRALGKSLSWLLSEGEALSVKDRSVKPVNRRIEIPVMKIARRSPGTVGAPKWLDLAAGEGKDLSLCEDLIYFDKRDNFKGLHTAEIRGDSMIDTLFDGDIIVLKPFAGVFGVELPPIESEDEKQSLAAWQEKHDIREGAICVLAINHDAPTLKRIHYDTRRGHKNWKLQIVADNPSAFDTFQADLHDHVVFYAKMVARAE